MRQLGTEKYARPFYISDPVDMCEFVAAKASAHTSKNSSDKQNGQSAHEASAKKVHRRAAFSLSQGAVCGMHKHVQKITDRWNQNILQGRTHTPWATSATPLCCPFSNSAYPIYVVIYISSHLAPTCGCTCTKYIHCYFMSPCVCPLPKLSPSSLALPDPCDHRTTTPKRLYRRKNLSIQGNHQGFG